MNIEVNAASACLPGKPIIEAITRITQGVTEPLWGRLGTQHVQICPQHPGRITEETVDRLQAIAPSRAAHPVPDGACGTGGRR